RTGALNYICERMGLPPDDVFGVATFYHLFSRSPRPATVVHICDDIACRLQGAEEICAEAESKSARFGPDWTWQRSSCLGQCERGPAALVIQAGVQPKSFVASGGGRPSPFSEGNLLKRVGHVDPESLDAYRGAGGYKALERAIASGPGAVIQEVTASNLVGRGGAAFPTGRKWDAVAKAAAQPHYVVCNADESEPGTFKDRTIMEGDPFAVIEGMTIAAYATASERGYIYIRGEYPLATR